MFVHGLAEDEHHVVVGEGPVVPLLLPQFLGGYNTFRQIGHGLLAVEIS